MYGKICYDKDILYLRFFEIEFPAIIYNDALASKSNFSSDPPVSPQHINEINLKNETSLFKNNDEEYNVISYNDLVPFNINSVNDSKLDKDNDDENIDIKQSLGDISIEPLLNIQSVQVKDYQRILLEGFQDNTKYEHVGSKTQDRKKAENHKRCLNDDARLMIS
ncbi:hypothetical protein Tco_1153669 [Tanacetum coccineum]